MSALDAPTPSQTVGPFFSLGLCVRPSAEIVPPGTAGAVELVGRVFDGAGEPVSDAMLEIRHADADGHYRRDFGWGRDGTDPDGSFRFVTVLPGTGHVWCYVFARGLLKPVLTRFHFPGGEASDPLLSLLGPDERRRLTVVPEGPSRYRIDVHLQGELQTPFFAP